MSAPLKRFYITTGKGGVGKTTLSLAHCKYLKDQGHKVCYAYFKSSALDKNNKTMDFAPTKELNIESLALELSSNAKEYITSKFKSETIAGFITESSLFKAMVNMVPGLNYLIYIGKIFDLLRQDQELIVVLDSPSSGHAITMLEAADNFNQIFSSGVLFEDSKKVVQKLKDPEMSLINIITLPSQLAVSEAIELRAELRERFQGQINIICNNSFTEIYEKIKDRPKFLNDKAHMESSLLVQYKKEINATIGHSLANSLDERVNDLANAMTKLC